MNDESGDDLPTDHATFDVRQWMPQLASVPSLTSREREVFLLLGNGSGNREIAKRLAVSERMVKAHLTRIMLKLRVESRLQAGLVSCLYQLDGERQSGEAPGPEPRTAP